MLRRALVYVAAAVGLAKAAPPPAFIDQYCIGCHKTTFANPTPQIWEKAIVKLRAGMMPPKGAPRPSAAVMDRFVSSLEQSLDRAAPNAGKPALHRLNRVEYANSVHDL